MGADHDKILARAERKLRSGKAENAVDELRRLAATSGKDLALANRIGDLLARTGRGTEAIEFYERTARAFAQAGLYPKAVAVGKKILRLHPDRTETLVEVADWYLAQQIPGEARSYLLHAADQFAGSQQFAKAREVYERLVRSEPAEPRHRVRLAESLAAEGRDEEAGEQMLALAASLGEDRAEQAENSYRRAMELLPLRDEPVLGLVRVLVAAGREADAVDCLEALDRGRGITTPLRGELAVLYDAAGRSADAFAALALAIADAETLPEDALSRFLGRRIESGGVDEFWDHVGPALALENRRSDDAERCAAVLEQLAALEPEGHVPALERLAAWREDRGDEAAVGTLERLRAAYRAGGRASDASGVDERLAAIAGPGPAADPASNAREPGSRQEGETDGDGDPAAPAEVDPGAEIDVPVEFEAPAVPLNRSDEEFVSGRMTQAEILEKYGLHDKAVDQVREVVARFPGHVEAQSRLLRLMEDGGTAAAVRDAAVGLALALRAAGDADGARRAARCASESAPLNDEVAGVLGDLGLLDAAAEDSAAVPPEEAPASARGAETGEDADEVVIDFDAFVGEADAPAASPGQAEEPRPARPEPEPVSDEAFDEDPGSDDLAELAQALESELFADDIEAGVETVVPEAGGEESLEDVFAAFRERVQEEVASDDHRTHYDLAIGYKEMGMLDEAISEFEIAASSPDLRLEASVMIATIRREQGDAGEAVRWYRNALDHVSGRDDDCRVLRYELADALAQAGEPDEALRLFRDLSVADPSFRDVASRISELEARDAG